MEGIQKAMDTLYSNNLQKIGAKLRGGFENILLYKDSLEAEIEANGSWLDTAISNVFVTQP